MGECYLDMRVQTWTEDKVEAEEMTRVCGVKMVKV